MNETLLGNPVDKWLLALGILVGTLAIIWLLMRVVRRQLLKLSQKTTTILDDLVVAVLASTKKILLVFVAAWAAIQVLQVPAWVGSTAQILAIVALLLQIGLWANKMLTEWVAIQRRRKADEEEAVTWLSGLEWAGKMVIWTLVLLIGLENLGIDVTGLVTGLGIGGIAVALAVQNILGDLFSSFSIFFDKPFVIGDFLAVDSFLGSVESIGLKTTRLRSISGEQLVFSNSDLLQSRIRNYGRMEERRAIFSIGVTYDTVPEKVERIPNILREIIEARGNTRFDRSHFKEFGDFALLFETVYYMLVPDYAAYMETQQAINLEILRRFQDEGIEFAYPTQTLLLESLPDSESAATT
jgi:small-conductance mechanosensitive channel